MKRLLLVCAVAALVAATTAGACGVERWNIKVLRDPAAKLIDWHPLPATIASLSAMPGGNYQERQPFEKHVYRVTATLSDYKLEADGDVHAILEQAGQSMIVELPNVACTYGAQHRYVMFLARQAFDTAFHPSTTWTVALGRTVTVTGVYFADRLHHQRGVAVNGSELHPVISLRLG